MLWRIKLRIKIRILSNIVRRIEAEIINYRYDMRIQNELYYCGRGDLELWCENYCNYLYWRISVCQRLINMYKCKLDGVVGQEF